MSLADDLERLRDLARAEPCEFVSALRALLAADFDVVFGYVKTQKLLHRKRSCAWILQVEREIQGWLPRAPLNGKKKAQLKRHFAFCLAIQDMLDIIDRRSQPLKIWQVTTETLLRALFSVVEEHREQLEVRIAQGEGTSGGARGGLRGAETERRELRNYCDWVARIVNQISLVGVRSSGEAEISAADVREALGLAAMTDMVLVVLDCYSYKNFPVSVSGKEVKLRGIRSKTQQALDWSTLRERSRNLIDNYQIATNREEARRLIINPAAGSDSFELFLEADTGTKVLDHLRISREEMERILRQDVGELIDLDFPIRTASGTFTADELLRFWALLFQIASCASVWRRICCRDGAPLLSIPKLASLAAVSLGCGASRADSLISQFLFDAGKRNQDPFFRPLIKLDDSRCLVACTFIETGRFARNLFTIAIREGRVDFSPKGLKPLQDLRELFADAGYRAILNFPVRDQEELAGDVDIAAARDGYLFLGQTKVLIHPDSAYDEWKVLENLKKAAQQLVRSMPHLKLLADHLGVSLGTCRVVPFLLTNVWHYTGSTVDGFRVVDFSYLSNILTGGEVWEVSFLPTPTRRIAKLIEGRYPTAEELSKLILNPLHEEMFQRQAIKEQLIHVGEWKLYIPVEVHDANSESRRTRAMERLLRDLAS
jgi:hypothetical protein